MNLHTQLAQQKAILLKKWFNLVVDTYPADTAQFLRSQSDPFANPIGQTTLQSLEALLAFLLHDPNNQQDEQDARDSLDPIIRIRAIQDFTPSQAVKFVFDFKGLIKESLKGVSRQKDFIDQWESLEQRINDLGLMAFDIFMQCREKIYELKANEMKNRTYSAVSRAGLIKEQVKEE